MHTPIADGPSPIATTIAATTAAPRRLPRMPRAGSSVLAWPAWWRLLVMVPVIAALWLGVAWARLEASPW